MHRKGSTLTSLVTYNGGHTISGMVSISTAPSEYWPTAQKTASKGLQPCADLFGARPTDRDRSTTASSERQEAWRHHQLRRTMAPRAACAATPEAVMIAHTQATPLWLTCRVEWLHN
jgi:hypothetical protein